MSTIFLDYQSLSHLDFMEEVKGFGNVFLPCSLFLQTVNYSLSTSINKCTHICYSKYGYILVIFLIHCQIV